MNLLALSSVIFRLLHILFYRWVIPVFGSAACAGLNGRDHDETYTYCFVG